MHGLLSSCGAVFSFLWFLLLESTSSVVVVHRLSNSTACGILDQDQTHVPCIGRWIPNYQTTRVLWTSFHYMVQNQNNFVKKVIDFSLPHLPHVPCPLLLLVSVYTSCVTVYTYRQNLESACWHWILSPPLLAVTSYWTSVCFYHSQVNIINVRAHELIQFIFPTEVYSQGQELKQEV